MRSGGRRFRSGGHIHHRGRRGGVLHNGVLGKGSERLGEDGGEGEADGEFADEHNLSFHGAGQPSDGGI